MSSVSAARTANLPGLLTRITASPLVRSWLVDSAADTLEASVYRFILRYSLPEQIYLVVGTLLSFPFLYGALELPKLIINDAIGGKHPATLLGHEMSQIPYLLLLCLVFLLLVVINGWFKYHLNVRKGRTGERMLRRLRFELYQRLLRFPLRHFDRTATGEIIAMLTAELEPVGGFIGDAFALPISQAGTLLTIIVFMFVQNPLLGAAAVALYPLQAYLIPKMQRKIRALGRERVRKMRGLSDRIGESIAAQVEIRSNGGMHHQMADISRRLGEIYDLRFDIYNRKFLVKFLNNFLGQLTPFLFYAIGGYFVISGELSFGALVAVLAAYKDLSSPWKELLDFYQNQQDVAIKYEQVVEQFQVADMLDRSLVLDQPDGAEPPHGEIVVADVSLIDGDGMRQLDGIGFTVRADEHVAIVGPGNSGKNRVLQLLARLYGPTSGRITIGGAEINTLPLAVTGRMIGYVGPTTHLFAASLRDNLLLGLRHRPSAAERAEPAGEAAGRALIEAQQSGNFEYDGAEAWLDYALAGVEDAAGLDRRIAEILRAVELDRDVYLLGLHGRVDPAAHPEIAEKLLEARRLLAQRLEQSGLAALIERFDPDRYNPNASVADNLLFGTALGGDFDGLALAENEYVGDVLQQVGVFNDLLRIGAEIAEMMVEMFGDLPPEHGFFEQYAFVSAEDLPELEKLLARKNRLGADALPPADQTRLLGLALKLVAARDRLGLVDATIQQRIVEARRAFAEGLPEALDGAVEIFDPQRYAAAASVQDNVLFGTLDNAESDSREQVEAVIGEVLEELGLFDAVVAIGLDYQVGTGGSRLAPAQRQKLAIARAVLKRPVLLALDEATAVLDPVSETGLIEALRQEFAGRCIVANLSRPAAARDFDRVLVMDQGRLVQDGEFDSLDRKEGPLAPLLAAE